MTRFLLPAVFVLVLTGCATGARSAGSARPILPDAPSAFLLPSPSWPERLGEQGRRVSVASPADWQLPPSPLGLAVLPAQPRSLTGLPLPGIQPLPLRATPLSRSWTRITQAKPPAAPPVPSAPKTTKPAVKAVTPAPQTAPVKPAAPTAAAAASLLPKDDPAAADFRWEDVNAVAGDAVTLHFDKTNWLYLDPPAQQKILGFQSIARDKDATTFLFKPLTPGQYTLEFQRQDLVNQSTDLRRVKLTVVPVGTRTAATGTALSPQTSTAAANDALEASRILSASGKTAEAVQKLLQAYRADDARINLELARLLSQTGQDDEALSYLEKNLTLSGPDFEGTLVLGTRLAAARDAQKKLPAYVKLWTTGTTTPPEDLFLQVFDALRKQKMTPLLKDWSARYPSWYAAPKLKDRFLFLSGQWMEEPGEGRDVRGAWKAYNEVVQSFPLSPYWKAAGERAAYLNRNFLQVR